MSLSFRRHLLSICQRLCSFIAFYAFFMSLVFRPTRLTASCLTSMLLEATPIEIRASAIALHPLVLSSLFLILWSFLHCSSSSGHFFIVLHSLVISSSSCPFFLHQLTTLRLIILSVYKSLIADRQLSQTGTLAATTEFLQIIRDAGFC